MRGDEPARTFERWAYDEPTLEVRLGAELYLELVSTDFGDPRAVESIREQLGPYVRALPGQGCHCIRLCDLDVVDFGLFRAPSPAFEQDRDWYREDVLDTIEEVRRRGQPYWWLSVRRCTACGQAWLVGAEERVNDLYCLRRLAGSELRAIEEKDRWPEDFDRYERLIRIGRHAGRNFQFIDPLNSSLGDTLADLARARPGIGVSELAGLLSLYFDEAEELARRAVARGDVSITFDTQGSPTVTGSNGTRSGCEVEGCA